MNTLSLANEWHPTKNNGLAFSELKLSSSVLTWWLCKEGHEWESKFSLRAVRGSQCPFCTNRKVLPGFNDLASMHPELISEWSEFNQVSPFEVIAGGRTEYFWICSKGHQYSSKIANRVRGRGCTICANKQVQVGVNDFQFLYPELASQWHPTKNGAVEPSEVIAGGRNSYWWLCDNNHEWETKIGKRIVGQGCPSCAGNIVVPGANDLLTAFPEIVNQWHFTKSGNLKPSDVTKKSTKKVWWLCSKGHEWEAAVFNRTHVGNNCPVCANYVLLPGFNDLATTHPDLTSEWHIQKNTVHPNQIVYGSAHRAWWVCKKGHEWQARVVDRSSYKMGCLQCWSHTYVSKAEQEIADHIKSILPEIEVLQSDRKVLKGFELDIYVPSKNLAVEFNGVYWHSEAQGKGKNYHYNKWLKAKTAGVQLIQIWEDDWKRNPELIKNMLAHKLSTSVQPKVFGRKTETVIVSSREAELFLTANHIQGFASGTHYLGLKHNNILVSLLVLRAEQNGNVLNIIRYATSVQVVGGFTKLLTYAEKTFTPDRFITFADHMVSNGGLYESNGFVADKFLKPDYMYVVGDERKHKFGYRLVKFRNDPNLRYVEGMTEKELAELNGLERVWDAGKTRYVKLVADESSD